MKDIRRVGLGVVAVLAARLCGAFDDTGWHAAGEFPGTDGIVEAVAVDGAGNLYAGGSFRHAGGVEARGIAKWNGAAWSALGAGVDGKVNAIAVDASGRVFAGGDFTNAGGIVCNRVAMWNGTSWSALGSGVDATVVAMACDAAGDVFAGGVFSNAGGVAAAKIARWNGSSWSPLGTGVSEGAVMAILPYAPGQVYVGGQFRFAGGLVVNSIAKWNGSQWSALSTGMKDVPHPNYSLAAGPAWKQKDLFYHDQAYVLTLVLDNAGRLFAGGYFAIAGRAGVSSLAVWDGARWSNPVTADWYQTVEALARDSAGNIHAAGSMWKPGMPVSIVVGRLTGTGWTALANWNTDYSYTQPFRSLVIAGNGELFTGGYFVSVEQTAASCICRWRGGAWSTMAQNPGLADSVFSLAADRSGNVCASGEFLTAGTARNRRFAIWNGQAWSGHPGKDYGGLTLASDPAGFIYAGGGQTIGDVTNYFVMARWNGSAWTGLPFPFPFNMVPSRVAAASTDRVYAANSEFWDGVTQYQGRISCWVGNAWVPIATNVLSPGSNERMGVRALHAAGGQLFAGGIFSNVDGLACGHIAHWTGNSWSNMGGGVDFTVEDIIGEGGNIYAGGHSFTNGANRPRVAMWNGTSWTNFGSGTNGWIASVEVDGLGGVYVGGYFKSINNVAATNIAKWDGQSWSALASGVGGMFANYDAPGGWAEGSISAMALDSRGRLFAAGTLTEAGGRTAAHCAFADVASASLSVTGTPWNGGYVGGAGIFRIGSTQTVSAVARRGWLFTGWQDASSNGVRAVIVPSSGASFTASFVLTGQTISVVNDFDNDGRSDIATFYPAGGAWNAIKSSGGTFALQFGYSATVSVAADYDGDGQTDVALYDGAGGNWHIIRSSTGAPVTRNWGNNAMIPVPADYDGDGKADIAVYDRTPGMWYVLRSSDGGLTQRQWGWSPAIPVPADYDGDGKADIATYVPASGQWSILRSSDGGLTQLSWGWTQAMPVPADFDGDEKADIAVYVPSSGQWSILKSAGGSIQQQWGWTQAAPVPADYDGDGKADIATYVPSSGQWSILKSAGGSIQQQWGWTQAAAVMPQFQINRRYFPVP